MLTNPPPSSSGANVPPQAPDPKRAARRRWSIFGLIAAVLLVYIVFVFWTRAQDNKLLERERAEKLPTDQRTEDEKAVEALGGTDFKILAFYAQPELIHKGDEGEHVLRRRQYEDGHAHLARRQRGRHPPPAA